jgi:hypothetical protein
VAEAERAGLGRVERLEAEARQRFARWDPALWRDVCDGPARTLAEGLRSAGATGHDGEALLESYLRLASEGIGLGYLYPASAGAQSFFTLAWTRLVPASLPSLPPERRAAVLADCWNLGENLESAPVWLRRIFLRVFAGREGLADLQAVVADVSSQALGEPGRRLQGPARVRIEWLYLAHEDPRFLPGPLHFLAPTVVCVHDRSRTGGDGRDAAAVGAWLGPEPLFLGAMGCDEAPAPDPGLRLDLLEELERRQPMAADWRAMAANEWRAAVTLETSQYLVALLPR